MIVIIYILNLLFPNSKDNASRAVWVLLAVLFGLLLVIGLWINSCLDDRSIQQQIKQQQQINANLQKLDTNSIESEINANHAAENQQVIENRIKERQTEINSRLQNVNRIRMSNIKSNINAQDLINKANELYP